MGRPLDMLSSGSQPGVRGVAPVHARTPEASSAKSWGWVRAVSEELWLGALSEDLWHAAQPPPEDSPWKVLLPIAHRPGVDLASCKQLESAVLALGT